MRFALATAALTIASAAQAQDQRTTYHLCTLYGATAKGPYSAVAVTEPFPVDKIQGGMSAINSSFDSFKYDLSRGRVSIPGIDPASIKGGSCQAGTTDIESQHEVLRRMRVYHNEVFVLFPSPVGRDGRYLRRGTIAKAAPKAAKPGVKPAVTDTQRVRHDNPLGKTPNQVKYELAQAVHQARLAKLAQEKAALEAIKERQRADARAVLSQHDQALDRHRQVVAASEREQAEYRARLAAPARTPDEKVEFKEGVVLCQKRSASSKEWRCPGPLQVTYANLDNLAKALVSLGEACGSSKSIRDLGMVSGYRAFGCGFGIHPTARDYPGNTDVPAMLGVGYVPGRASYYCPRSKLAYCRG